MVCVIYQSCAWRPDFEKTREIKNRYEVTTQVQSSGVHGSRLENDEYTIV